MPRTLLLAIVVAAAVSVHGQVVPPALYVSDHNLADPHISGIVRVNKDTGAQTVITAGGYLSDLFYLTLEAPDKLLVADAGFGSGKVIRVDAITGTQTLLASNLGHAIDLTIGSGGFIYVTDDGFGLGGSVRRVDPVTGASTTLSLGGRPAEITSHPDGYLYFSGFEVAHGQPGIARLNPSTGCWSLFASGGLMTTAGDLAVDTNGDLLMVDNGTLAPGDGRIIRFDHATGTQSVFSNVLGSRNPRGIYLDAAGNVFMGDWGDTASTGISGVWSVARSDGALTALSIGQNFTNVTGITGIDHPIGHGPPSHVPDAAPTVLLLLVGLSLINARRWRGQTVR